MMVEMMVIMMVMMVMIMMVMMLMMMTIQSVASDGIAGDRQYPLLHKGLLRLLCILVCQHIFTF